MAISVLPSGSHRGVRLHAEIGRSTPSTAGSALGFGVFEAGRTIAPAPVALFPIKTLWTLPLNSQLRAAPAFAGTHAYFPIEGDQLAAYDLISGEQEWIVRARPAHQPVAGDGLVFIDEPGLLTALRTNDGGVYWQLPFAEPLATPLVWDAGWLVAATGQGALVALRASDGHRLWRRDMGARVQARPALSAGRLYAATEDGRLTALQIETGEPVWERRLGGPASGILVLDDRLYVGSSDNFFYCLETAGGRTAWRWRTGGDVVGLPVADERSVYFVSLDNLLRAVSRKSGVQQWVRPLPLRPTRGPLKSGPTLVVSGIAPVIGAYNARDGSPAGDIATSGEVAASPYFVADWPLPQLLYVTRTIARGATATLVTREIEPKVIPLGPLPNPVALPPTLPVPSPSPQR